jgi:hypothetical protein
MNFFQGLADWPFLNEPLWRWAIFMLAIGLISAGWAGVLDFMK